MTHETRTEQNAITSDIIGAAIRVHRELGPGLLESAYQACMEWELRSLGLSYVPQCPIPVAYHDVELDCGYRADLLVEDMVLVELKTVEHLTRLHQAQLMTYLRLVGCGTGLLLNFNVPVLKAGIRRIVMD